MVTATHEFISLRLMASYSFPGENPEEGRGNFRSHTGSQSTEMELCMSLIVRTAVCKVSRRTGNS